MGKRHRIKVGVGHIVLKKKKRKCHQLLFFNKTSQLQQVQKKHLILCRWGGSSFPLDGLLTPEVWWGQPQSPLSSDRGMWVCTLLQAQGGSEVEGL